MNLLVERASVDERDVVDRLLQLCLHDYSSHDPFPIGDDGRFDYRWRDLYWSSPRRQPYLLRLENQLAGFVLVRSPEEDELGVWNWQIAEFFVLRALRSKKVGTVAALALLRSKPGVWEVSYDITNVPARHFWASIARSFDPTATLSAADAGRERYLLRNREEEDDQALLTTPMACSEI
jgi:predicted acetyltransferase